MAQIGHGYGSEWQLLRMLGHHREYFFKELREQLGLTLETEIHWLDYGWDESMVSGDKEFKKREFFEMIPSIFTPERIADLKNDRFGDILNQNWDGVFWVDDVVYLVEAKAHIEEIKSDCQATNKNSVSKIEQYFKETRNWFGIITDNDWKQTYYQMANRVAFLKLLQSHGVESRLVDIYFIDGYEKKVKDPDSGKYIPDQTKNTTKEQWLEVIAVEEQYLGISKLTGKSILPVFVNCKRKE